MTDNDKPAISSTPNPVSITVETIKGRHYLRGTPFASKQFLWEMGAQWDAEQKAWWIEGKRKEAEALLAQALERFPAQPAKKTEPAKAAEAGVDVDARVIVGKAKYRGKVYHVLVAPRRSKDGALVCKLAFRNGSGSFWAKEASEVQMLREYREPTSINALRAFAEQMRRGPAQGTQYECEECGEWVTAGEGECGEAGHAH